MKNNPIKNVTNVNPEILNEIHEALSVIKFGEVVITIHDAKIVQIEKKEKKRFTVQPDCRSCLK